MAVRWELEGSVRVGRALVVLGLMTSLAACESAPSATTEVIDEAGGTIESAGARVEVPAGALSSPVEVGVRVADASGFTALPEGTTAAGSAVVVTPHGTTFATPVTITIPLADGGADQVLRLDDESDTTWDAVIAEIGATSAIVTTDRFSVYVPVRSSAECANPCGPDSEGLSCAGCDDAECGGASPAGGSWGCRCDSATGLWDCSGTTSDAGVEDAGPSACPNPCALESDGLMCDPATCGPCGGASAGGGSWDCSCEADAATDMYLWSCTSG